MVRKRRDQGQHIPFQRMRESQHSGMKVKFATESTSEVRSPSTASDGLIRTAVFSVTDDRMTQFRHMGT